MKSNPFLFSLIISALLSSAAFADEESPWKSKLKQELPILGHRNWIVIVDSAYPWQTSAGIETVETGEEMPVVISAVLDAVAKTPHVKPVLFTDSELPFVSEADAPGISSFRAALNKALAGQPTTSLPHEQIIAKLDEAGKTFHVLVLKTHLNLPYTSLFLQLQCGYWNVEAEKRLRAVMAGIPR